MNDLIDATGEQTMSSREIAELCNKRHDHAMRDIRDMLGQLHGESEAPRFGGYYIAENGKQNPCFHLPKRETLILVSGDNLAVQAYVLTQGVTMSASLGDKLADLACEVQYDLEKVVSLAEGIGNSIDDLAGRDGIADAVKNRHVRAGKAIVGFAELIVEIAERAANKGEDIERACRGVPQPGGEGR